MKPLLIGIGEILWDLLPAGKQLGGAPANFAYHANALGATGIVISRVGDDANGREILERLQAKGLKTDRIQPDRQAPTGTVSVELGVDGQPSYTIHENVAWDRIVAGENEPAFAAEADAICFGTLAQRSATSREAIQTLVSAARPDALRILDANLRQRFFSREVLGSSLLLANTLKVNNEELPLIAEMFGIAGNARAQMAGLAERFELHTVACTRGARGSLLYSRDNWAEHPGASARVVDTIGAGDSFTAAMAIGLLAGWPLETINYNANLVAAHVASSVGGMPAIPEEIRRLFRMEQT